MHPCKSKFFDKQVSKHLNTSSGSSVSEFVVEMFKFHFICSLMLCIRFVQFMCLHCFFSDAVFWRYKTKSATKIDTDVIVYKLAPLRIYIKDDFRYKGVPSVCGNSTLYLCGTLHIIH